MAGRSERSTWRAGLGVLTMVCVSSGLFSGCGVGDIDIEIEDVVAALGAAVGQPVQTRPQQLPPVLIQEGHTIVIDNQVTIIDNPRTDIIVSQLPDETILGFENDTGFDIFVEYFADGVYQSVYVYDGEALLLAYPCLDLIELDFETDIDPFTGEIVAVFDLLGVDYFNPDDFLCGEAFILSFDPFAIEARAEAVPLLR
jgi:hypothetical protein